MDKTIPVPLSSRSKFVLAYEYCPCLIIPDWHKRIAKKTVNLNPKFEMETKFEF